MARNVFIVDAVIADANGTVNRMEGYPKHFDSRSYQNDVDKARRRAEGDFSEAWGAMCKRDDRQMQTVVLYTIDGFQLDSKSYGQFPDE